MNIVYFVICYLLLADMAFTQDADFTIVTEEWAPYNYLENGKIVGLSTEIVERIMDIIKVKYEMTLLPSMRTTRALNTQPHTIMFSMFKTADRINKYKWVGPIVEDSISFYKRKVDATVYRSLADLKKADTVACRNAGLITNLLLSMGFANLDMSAAYGLSVYMKLIQGRCDLAISDTDLGVRYAINKIGHDIAEVEKIPIEIFKADLYIAFSYDCDDKFVEKWQKALDVLKTSGELASIIQKYK